MSNPTTFGQRLTELLQERDLTQSALADKIELSRSTISRYCRDKAEPDDEHLTAIAAALDLDVEALVAGTIDRSDDPGEAPEPNESAKDDDGRARLQAQVAALDERVATLEAALAERDAALLARERELDELNTSVSELDEERAAALNAKAEAEARITDLEAMLRKEKTGVWLKSSAIGVAGAGVGALLGYLGRDK